jgi:glycosyltransferase involved in cell wall biosynthesis
MVINGGYPASLLCRVSSVAWRLSGKKHSAIFNYHNLVQASKWPFSILDNKIDLAVIKSCSTFITVSEACRLTLSNRPAFKFYNNSFYIYNGINNPSFDSKNNYDSKPYCLMLATYEIRKGHEYLLKAFKIVINKYPNIILQIFGHGSKFEHKRIQDLVSFYDLTSNVFLNDFVDDTEYLIRNSKILLIPSQSFESFGLTAIEAMSIGIPIVSTDVGGLPEIIANNGAGIVCSKDSYIDFANAIIKILSSDELKNKLSKQGKSAFLNNFTSKRMSLQYSTIIKSINP